VAEIARIDQYTAQHRGQYTDQDGKPRPDQRLRRLQHLLIDLINVLDERGLRFEAKLTKRCHRASRCSCSKCSGSQNCPCVTCNPNVPEDVGRNWGIGRALGRRQLNGDSA
jgi:hypothetical protein